MSNEELFLSKLQESIKDHVKRLEDPELPTVKAKERFKYKCDSIDRINRILFLILAGEKLKEGDKEQLAFSFCHVLELKEIINSAIERTDLALNP